jgi:hypothetical protein
MLVDKINEIRNSNNNENLFVELVDCLGPPPRHPGKPERTSCCLNP